MDWITGLQNAIDYIEDHLLEDIDYETVAAQSYSSSYHFQRIFSILCGFTIGDYIRYRRLSLAGAELAGGNIKVIDAALKYGYESPDSFAKAFQKFHGILPSQARGNGKMLKSYSRLALNLSMKGGTTMNYRIERKPKMILTGYKTHFRGTPYGKEREEQEEELFITTRGKQWFLRGAASMNPDAHCVITNITDEGYDYYYCHLLDDYEREHLYDHTVTGVDFVENLDLLELEIPESDYVIFETANVKNPISDYFNLLNLRLQILTEWMPEMEFELKPSPELAVYHWLPKNERNVQIWLPIEKRSASSCISPI